jgi:hypothetical protein
LRKIKLAIAALYRWAQAATACVSATAVLHDGSRIGDCNGEVLLAAAWKNTLTVAFRHKAGGLLVRVQEERAAS